MAFLILGLNDPARGVNDDTRKNHSSASAPAPISLPTQPRLRASESFGPSSTFRSLENPNNATINSDQRKSEASDIGSMGSTPPFHSASVPKESWSQLFTVMQNEVKEILSNKYFLCSLAGTTANNFALGGLADWFATYMLRYTSTSLAAAGLYAGAATIVGGILGNVLGI